MPNAKQLFVAGAMVALTSYSNAQSSISRNCPIPSSGICYELNIPEATANSGTGDIYFSISAPTKYQWLGLGQGQRMRGANMFVVYTSADGQNVTVSPRMGANHVEPEGGTSNAQIEILEGSGVSNGTMTANIRCSNCNSWNGGTMDFSGMSGSWIHAELAGDPLMSDDMDAEISYHSENGVFDWPFADAKGGSSVNPFIAINTAVTDGSGDIQSSGGAPPSNLNDVMMAHGIVASLAFVIFFPTGGIIIRLANFTGLIWVHAGIQLIGYALFISAFGMGLWMAINLGYISEGHAIVGYIIFALVVFQPLGGLLHHAMFKKTGSRSVWSFGHIYLGRIAIILGMVNGGLGLQLAGNASNGQIAAYGVVAGLFGVAFLAAAAFGEYKKATALPSQSSQFKDDLEVRDASSSEAKAS